jgi:intein/homing endonuclease
MVSNEAFRLKVIPVLNPLGVEYLNWWKEQKRKCIEGSWQSGKYMPGVLYFYINFWHIKLNKSINSKVKVLAKPFLRDIEWEKAYVYVEAKGFSGFSEDKVYTCHRDFEIRGYGFQEISSLQMVPLELEEPTYDYEKDTKYRKLIYKSAREILRTIHGKDMGKPMFENSARNIIDIECFGLGTRIRMFDGSVKAIEDINSGDLLLGPDSTPRKVMKTHTGEADLYRIKSKKFSDQVVTGMHKVQLIKRNFINGKYINKKRQPGIWEESVESISALELFIKQGQPSFTNTHYLYQVGEITYQESKTVEIDPYYLGLWLADGRSNCTSINITDPVLWDYLKDFAKANNIDFKETITQAESNRKEAREYYYYSKEFRQKFKDYKLLNNKYIPEEYLTASIEFRRQLLAGLIDGDGCVDKNSGSFSICCGKNYKLAEEVQTLARSLGFYSRIKITKGNLNHVLVSGNYVNLIPTKLERKQITRQHSRIDVNRSSFDITPEGFGKFIGLEVDQDHLFLLEDFTVVHNCRESGKSYFASCMIGHNFLFDGAVDYDEYLAARSAGLPMSSETMVGAIDAFYSKGLLDKVQLGFDNIEGGMVFGKDYYPAPLMQHYEGSFAPSKWIQAKQEKKVGNTWLTKGSKSILWHRTFRDNELAANGTRASLNVLEEVGFMGNLLDSLGALKECTLVSGRKFGVILMTGTGGDMEGGATEAAKEVFYHPEDYECLAFEDIWENKGKIGYFVPKQLALNQYKNLEGITDINRAQTWWEGEYEKAKKANDRKVVDQFLQNSPGRPSDAFLSTGGSILPVADLKAHLAEVETKAEYRAKGIRGELIINDQGKVQFMPDVENKLREAPYPIKATNNNVGCVTIYDFPETESPAWFRYIAGTDPYAQDQSTGDSIGSTFIYKRSVAGGLDGDILVAEYSGRPSSMKEHNEIVRRLLMYYNAIDLYENMFINLKEYFENKSCLHLLADTPKFIKATANSSVSRGKGLHRTKDIANELEVYLRDWLLETNPNGKLNLQNIYSKELLHELIAYNSDGNFDRVIALQLVIAYKIELTKQNTVKKETRARDTFFERKLFT